MKQRWTLAEIEKVIRDSPHIQFLNRDQAQATELVTDLSTLANMGMCDLLLVWDSRSGEILGFVYRGTVENARICIQQETAKA